MVDPFHTVMSVRVPTWYRTRTCMINSRANATICRGGEERGVKQALGREIRVVGYIVSDVWGLGFGVWGLVFEIWGLWFRVKGLGFRV